MNMDILDFKKKMSPPVEEAYKILRTNIQFCDAVQEVKTVVITSCYPGEGKTTTAVNLAISMAESGLKTLLIEADLRRPSFAKILDIQNHQGLTRLISGAAVFEEAVNKTSIEGFYFIPSGPKPPNPAELLGSKRFADIAAKAREEYDLVIYDTPPLGSIIDSALLAAQSDGTVLVVKPKMVRLKDAQRVKAQLEKAGARVLGAVLNQIPKRDFKSDFVYYKYYGGMDEKRRWLVGRIGAGQRRLKA